MSEPPAPSFPTYAELTQTQDWAAGGPVPVGMPSLATEQAGASRYTETAVLGRGGMGKVLLARDARIGREVAVKVLHGERKLGDEEQARFLREAQVQGQLEHPSIVPVYDIDRDSEGATFFTMRRVLGKTLQAILDELRAGPRSADGPIDARPRYTQRELLQAFATVCLTIDYAHSRGVVHRDLKPSNIMLGDFGEVYVLDWGIARVLESSATVVEESASRLSRPGATIGTPLYIAPEQVADPDVDAAADVFSLGAILFEILTLQRLRSVRAPCVPVEARPSVRTPQLQIARELEAICVKATQFEVADRYPSARALQEAVARYLEGDREIEARRALAATHAARARMAMGSDTPQDDLAMLELARALALDPTNTDHVAMMSDVLRAPLQTTPIELEQQIAVGSMEMIRSGAKYGAISIMSWFLFLPFVLMLGIRRLDYVVAIALPVAATGVLAFLASRRHTIGRPIQYATLCVMVIPPMMLSRLFGPLILVPTVLATAAIVVQAHPERSMRAFGLGATVLAMAIPFLLELTGLAPASYSFEGGFEIVPQMTEFPAGITIVFLGIASIATAVVPAVFVARLRAQLAETQKRELLQTWRIRRLGENMLVAAHAP